MGVAAIGAAFLWAVYTGLKEAETADRQMKVTVKCDGLPPIHMEGRDLKVNSYFCDIQSLP